MSINEEFISVADFALLTGLTPAQIEGRYTVQVGSRQLVPRFMISGHALPEVEHIDLIPTKNGARQTAQQLPITIETEAVSAAEASVAHAPDNAVEHLAEGEYRPIATIEMPAQVLQETSLQQLTPADPDAPPDPYVTSLERDAFELDNALNEATHHAAAQDSIGKENKSHRTGRVFSRSELGLRVHPFSRLIARWVDLTWESVALVLVLLALLQSIDSNLSSLFQTPLALAALVVMIAPLTLLLDAIIYSVFKNTPGKYLMGLRVVSKRLRTLKFTKYLRRNFRMWGRLLGYGIIPLAIFYMIREGFRLRRGLETNYDQAGRTRVGKKLNSKSSTLTLSAVACVALLYGLSLSGFVDTERFKRKANAFLPDFLQSSSSQTKNH